MRLLAIETASSVCSVALIEDGRVVDYGHKLVGRGHAEQLLPMIGALEGGGRPDGILVDVGPGSFTGVRVGVAAARALAFGWGVPVHGFHSPVLLAALDGYRYDTAVVIEGGHGEVFVLTYDGTSDPLPRSVPFADAVADIGEKRVVGNAGGRLIAARGWGEANQGDLDARDVVLLRTDHSNLPAIPFYGREADAKPMT